MMDRQWMDDRQMTEDRDRQTEIQLSKNHPRRGGVGCSLCLPFPSPGAWDSPGSAPFPDKEAAQAWAAAGGKASEMRCLVFSPKVQRKRVTLATLGQSSDGQVDGQESPSAGAGAHSRPWTQGGLPVVPSSPFSPLPTALPAPPHLSTPFSGAPVPPVTWPPWAVQRPLHPSRHPDP